MAKLKSIGEIEQCFRLPRVCPECKHNSITITPHWNQYLKSGDKAFRCGICGYTWIANKGEPETSVDAMIYALRKQVDAFKLE